MLSGMAATDLGGAPRAGSGSTLGKGAVADFRVVKVHLGAQHASVDVARRLRRCPEQDVQAVQGKPFKRSRGQIS